MKSSVNERIKEMRNKRGYTQAQFAELLGLKCSTYSQMERIGTISVEMAKHISKVLEIDSDYIIYGKKYEKPIDFSPATKPTLIANDPQIFFEKIKNGDEHLVLNVQEKNLIKNFRQLKKNEQQELFAFIQSKQK